MSEILKNLSLDRWYKVLIVLSAALMVVSLTVETVAISSADLFRIALGGFAIGIGEWINHKTYTQVTPTQGGFFHGEVEHRELHVGGVLLDVAGGLLVAWGLVRALLLS